MKTAMLMRLGKILFAALLVCGALAGCSARKQTGEPAVVGTQRQQAGGSAFSREEIAALESTGQIDRKIPEHAKNDIAAQYRYYLRDGRKVMRAISRQSEQYLAYARNVFRQRGMPEELANLAIVESGFKPDAVSRSGAAGAWQFMPFTGQKYGLAQDWWQDERLDPYRATEAAAAYLQKLYNDFGDWPTAIAAYNAGEGKMSRAKEGTGGKDFFEVKLKNHLLEDKLQLREETRQYVPRFMAVTKIMRNLPRLGFEPIAPEKAVEVARLEARPGTDLAAVSRAANLEWGVFQKYNLHHKRPITSTERTTYIYVPKYAQENARNFLCDSASASYAGWKPVRMANGRDSLEKISRRANIPLWRLRMANPGISSLMAGQIILLPGSLNLNKTALAAEERQTKAGSQGKTHQLQKGETLYSVAKKYNVSVQELAACNGLSATAPLRRGQVLRIPARESPLVASSSGSIGKRKIHLVRQKDNLWTIARKYNISVEDLKRWNNVSETNLRTGTVLVVEK